MENCMKSEIGFCHTGSKKNKLPTAVKNRIFNKIQYKFGISFFKQQQIKIANKISREYFSDNMKFKCKKCQNSKNICLTFSITSAIKKWSRKNVQINNRLHFISREINNLIENRKIFWCFRRSWPFCFALWQRIRSILNK